jgi:hypothetical protein
MVRSNRDADHAEDERIFVSLRLVNGALVPQGVTRMERHITTDSSATKELSPEELDAYLTAELTGEIDGAVVSRRNLHRRQRHAPPAQFHNREIPAR